MKDTKKSALSTLTLQVNGKTGTIQGETIIAFAVRDIDQPTYTVNTMVYGTATESIALGVLESFQKAMPELFHYAMALYIEKHGEEVLSAMKDLSNAGNPSAGLMN